MSDLPKFQPLPPDLNEIYAPSAPRDPTRQIFVNRDLNLAHIETVGFDMDYTLAPYHQHAMDALSIEMTVRKLIENKGYPEEIREAKLDHAFIIRGLAVDKETGNIFKMDSHRQVGRCYHGYQPVAVERRRELYSGAPIRLSSKRFAWIDTLFSLPEATLLAGVIEHFEGAGRPLPWSYTQLFDDVRESIDEAHRDNSLKAVITADIKKFISRDPDLPATLHKLRSAGKRLFLLTNSEWSYTDAVMKDLLDGALPFYKSWRNYFDIILVSGRKPQFFTENAPFLELDANGGPVGEALSLERGKVYQGGNVRDLQRLSGLAGETVLYVGDHIYGDIVRSKKHSGWRTALIVQEMEDTLRLTQEHRGELHRVDALEEMVLRLDHDINYHLTLLKSLSRWTDIPGGLTGPESRVIEAARDRAKAELDVKRDLSRRTLAELETMEAAIDRVFNPYWGRLFREGNERSLIGGQVGDYADVYTSRVSNFLSYSPVQYFRSPREVMPHERGY